MNFFFILIFSQFSLFTSQSAEAIDQNSKPEVLVIDPNVAIKNIPKNVYSVHKADEPNHELLASERDEILNRAGMSTEVAKWDHLAKDMLLQRAAFSSEQELIAKYPHISVDKLRNLQKIAKTKNIESSL